MNLSRIIFGILLFGGFLISSGCDPSPKEEATPSKAIDTVLDVQVMSREEMLMQRWTEVRDSSHVIVLKAGLWYDLYNGDTASVRPFRVLDDYYDKGGKPSPQGDHLVLEESPGNYYDFLIRDLDSFRLNLYYVAGDLEQFFVRNP